jgi:hypothetical protein
MKTSNRSFILDCRRHGPAVVSKRVCVLAIAALVAATVDLIAQSEFDFGDAPDPGYPTLLTNSGAYHAALNPTVILGTWIDGEPDGQPVPPGWGDDFNPPQQRDDEDGVRFPNALIAGVPSMVNVTVSGAGAQSWLQGWIDFDANFNWGDPGEQVILNSPVGNGSYAFPFPVGALTPAGRTYARFRVSTTPNLPFTGGASDGEVEDYEIH